MIKTSQKILCCSLLIFSSSHAVKASKIDVNPTERAITIHLAETKQSENAQILKTYIEKGSLTKCKTFDEQFLRDISYSELEELAILANSRLELLLTLNKIDILDGTWHECKNIIKKTQEVALYKYKLHASNFRSNPGTLYFAKHYLNEEAQNRNQDKIFTKVLAHIKEINFYYADACLEIMKNAEDYAQLESGLAVSGNTAAEIKRYIVDELKEVEEIRDILAQQLSKYSKKWFYDEDRDMFGYTLEYNQE